MSVRPRWKQGLCGNQTTSIGLSSPMQVTPSLVTPTTDRSSCDTNNTSSLLQLKRELPGRWDLALPRDCPVTGHTSIPTVSWLGMALGVCKHKPKVEPDTPAPNQAKRSRAVPWDSFRLETQEDVRFTGSVTAGSSPIAEIHRVR